MAKNKSKARVRIIKEQAPIAKADNSTQITTQEAYNAADWINPVIDMVGLKTMVKHSTILPQCVRAYKNNIAGFGIGVRYVDDEEETPSAPQSSRSSRKLSSF